MVGSYATRNREPGQARKGAAVSGPSRVPWGPPAGAGSRNSVGHVRVQSELHGHFVLPFVETNGFLAQAPYLACEHASEVGLGLGLYF